MNKLLVALPRWLFVILALSVGLVLIILFDPPHSKCDSQFDLFKSSQAQFLFTDPKAKFQKRTGYDKAFESCKQGNSPGACHDLFQGMKAVVRQIEGASSDCHEDLVQRAPVQTALTEVLSLTVRLAWGETPPESAYTRLGWLDTSHMALFCELKRVYIAGKGETAWASLREELMKELPFAPNLPRNEVWARSILSYNCQASGG